MEKESFLEDCQKERADIIVQKHLIDGTSFFFDKIQIGEEFEFKKDLASSLDVHIRDIVIVGSGKLGFSIKPVPNEIPYKYEYKKFDFDFENNIEMEKSDLDIAIVSGSLFDRQLVNLYEHTKSYSGTYFEGSNKKNFASYMLKGWFRPDFSPTDYVITAEILTVQEKYRMKYGRKINIGIYKSWFFFEKYHQNNIKNIQLSLIV